MPGLNWKPARRPRRAPLEGETVRLEPVDADRHAGDLFAASEGAPALWDYLAYGPFESERVFTSPEYLAVWGFSAWRPSIDRWTRDLLEPVRPDLGFATADGELLRAAFFSEGPEPAGDILGWLLARRPGVKGAVSAGLDRSCAAVAWESAPPYQVQEPFPEPPGATVAQALYRPLTPCLGTAGQRAAG